MNCAYGWLGGLKEKPQSVRNWKGKRNERRSSRAWKCRKSAKRPKRSRAQTGRRQYQEPGNMTRKTRRSTTMKPGMTLKMKVPHLTNITPVCRMIHHRLTPPVTQCGTRAQAKKAQAIPDMTMMPITTITMITTTPTITITDIMMMVTTAVQPRN